MRRPECGNALAPPDPLPRAVRGLAALGRRAWAMRVARRLLESDRAYEGRDGLILKVDPNDSFQVKMLLGWFDSALIELLRRHVRPGQVAIDAGGHIGYTTLQLARAVGPAGEVHTFECDQRLVGRIREHVRLNAVDWVRVNELAVYDSSGQTLDLRLTEQLGWATLHEGVWETSTTAAVTTVAIDDYVRDAGIDPANIGLIKLDVEGSEMHALEGMTSTLERAEAAVIVEFQPWRVKLQGREADDLLKLMTNCGYEPWAPQARRSGGIGLGPGAQPGVGEDVLFLPRRR